MNRSSNSIIGRLCCGFSKIKLAFLIFFVISMLMQHAIARFKEVKYSGILQFGFNEDDVVFDKQRNILFDGTSIENWYFIPDMFFILSLSWIFWILIKKVEFTRHKKYIGYKRFKIGFICFAGLSIIFDIYENLQYLLDVNILPWHISSIGTLKTVSIASLFILIFIYFGLHYSDTGLSKKRDEEVLKELEWNPSKMSLIFKASLISILMLLVIAFGLTFMDQGATLVVHLLDNGNKTFGIIQIIMMVMLVNLLAVIISHYPEYIQSALEPGKDIKWYLNKYKFVPGLITYSKLRKDEIDRTRENSKSEDLVCDANEKMGEMSKYGSYVTLFRYYLGVMTYVAWFYVLYKAFDQYGLANFDAFSSVILWSILMCFIIYYLFRIHSNDSLKIANEIKKLKAMDPASCKSTITEDAIKQVEPWTNTYLILLFLTSIIGVASLGIYFFYGWHLRSFHISIIYLFFNTLLYVFFRFTRSYQMFVWFDTDYVKKLLVKDKDFSCKEVKNINLEIKNTPTNNFMLKLIGNVSSNYYFLFYICTFTIISAIYLGSSFLLMGSYITCFSAIPLALSFFVLLYISIIYPIKLYLARGRKQVNDSEEEYFDKKKKYLISMFIFVGLIAIGYRVGKIENLHKLYYVEAKDAESLDGFAFSLEEHIKSNLVVNCDTIRPLVQISSFGGGLKSNLWTLLTLDALDDLLNVELSKREGNKVIPKRILDYTVSLSGVSGGAVGLGNYLVLDYKTRQLGAEHYDRDVIIRNIGLENILAIDAAGIFGHDRIKQTFTSSADSANPNFDRSYYAMQRYMKVLNETNDCDSIELLANTSFSELWCKMKGGESHNPALIINTASSGHEPGVSLSLIHDLIVFPGYIHLSDKSENKVNDSVTMMDLRYYDAISTSNRFPIMSPAGQVENDGFFLDGGYFENSGLLTSSNFRKNLNTSELIEKYPIGSVVIINSKSEYIRWFIEEHEITLDELESSTNIASVIAGITNIDKLPNVLLRSEESYKDKREPFFTIYLPHPILIDDIESVLGGTFISKDSLWLEKIVSNNIKVTQAMKKYYESRHSGQNHRKYPLTIESNGMVVPPLARTLSEPAVDYEFAMVTYHEDVILQIDAVVDYISTGIKLAPNSNLCKEEDNSDNNRKVQTTRSIIEALPKKEMIKSTRNKIDATIVKENIQKQAVKKKKNLPN